MENLLIAFLAVIELERPAISSIYFEAHRKKVKLVDKIALHNE